jgi:hypothetical protein
MKPSTSPKIKLFSAVKQRRLDELLAKNGAGSITPRERQRLQVLVDEAEALMVANAKLLAEFARCQSAVLPSQAIPVTVWVHPDLAET